LDIGKEKPAIIVEPLKDPFPAEPSVPDPVEEPTREPEREPVEAPG
jgi:hypothetical protein